MHRRSIDSVREQVVRLRSEIEFSADLFAVDYQLMGFKKVLNGLLRFVQNGKSVEIQGLVSALLEIVEWKEIYFESEEKALYQLAIKLDKSLSSGLLPFGDLLMRFFEEIDKRCDFDNEECQLLDDMVFLITNSDLSKTVKFPVFYKSNAVLEEVKDELHSKVIDGLNEISEERFELEKEGMVIEIFGCDDSLAGGVATRVFFELLDLKRIFSTLPDYCVLADADQQRLKDQFGVICFKSGVNGLRNFNDLKVRCRFPLSAGDKSVVFVYQVCCRLGRGFANYEMRLVEVEAV